MRTQNCYTYLLKNKNTANNNPRSQDKYRTELANLHNIVFINTLRKGPNKIASFSEQIKRIIKSGEAVLEEAAPEELLKNLLYYVARSKANSKFIQEIKEEYFDSYDQFN